MAVNVESQREVILSKLEDENGNHNFLNESSLFVPVNCV